MDLDLTFVFRRVLSFFSRKADQPLDDIRHLVEISKCSEALRSINKCLNLDSKNYDGHILKGGILQLMNKTTEAIEFYQKIIKKFPRGVEAYLDLIGIYSEPGVISGNLVKGYEKEIAWDRIITLAKQVRSIDKDKTPFFEMAEAYYSLNKFDLALGAYDFAIKQKALRIRAATIASLKKELSDDTRELCIQDISKNRKFLYRSLIKKAACYENLGKSKEAIEACKIAISMNAIRRREFESYELYQTLAHIYRRLGDMENASFCSKKGMELEKINNDAYEREQGRMTDEDFFAWYESSFEFDKDGEILRMKKDANKNE